jgi:hypothetical protein
MQLTDNSRNRFFLILLTTVFFSLLPLKAQDPQGCFLIDFHTKTAVIPPYEDHKQMDFYPTVIITVDHTDTLAKVSKYVYGNNSNPYMTQMVTEPDLLSNISKLSPNIIRYPGETLAVFSSGIHLTTSLLPMHLQRLQMQTEILLMPDTGMGEIQIAGLSLSTIIMLCFPRPTAQGSSLSTMDMPGMAQH